MKKTYVDQVGFTIIELMVCIVVVSALSVLALTNIRGVRAEKRDDQRKSDINAVYYQLESFHETNGYYPQELSLNNLKGIDPQSLVDNNGKSINQVGSVYSYTPSGCTDAKCTGFVLTTELEKEAPFVKLSLTQ